MRKTLTLAFVLAAMTAIFSGPAAASTAQSAAACPPGATDTRYCEIVVVPLGIKPDKAQHLLDALKNGIKVTVSCPTDCLLTVYATLPGATAKHFHAAASSTKRVGRGESQLDQAGYNRLKVRFTHKAKKGLLKAYKAKKLKTLKVGLLMVASNSAGAKKSIPSTLTLKK